MKSKKIDIDVLIAEISRLAVESPKNIYQRFDGHGCFYNQGHCTNGSIGCIFGQAFRNLSWDRLCEGPYIGKYLIEYGIKDIDKMDWCQAVQFAQDGGRCWKECVEKADASIHNRSFCY